MTLTIASAMRVQTGRLQKRVVEERMDSTLKRELLRDDDTTLSTPGLGWGAAPMQDGYTTPLCVNPKTGKIGTGPHSVYVTSAKQPVVRDEVTYSTEADLKFAFEGWSGRGLSGDTLQAAANSLLASTGGELKA